MARLISRKRCIWLALCLMVGVKSTATAQTPVISFTGSNTTSTISGSFDYYQPERVSPTMPGMFPFTGDKTDPYGYAYTIKTGLAATSHSAQGATEISTFTINTAANPTTMKTFVLTSTSGTTTVSIVLNTNSAMSTRALPLANVFTTNPPTTGTLTQTVAGVVTEFNISVTGSVTQVVVLPPPNPVAVAEVVCPYTAPAPYAVYACQAPPACCLSRFFAKRRCW